MLRANNSFSIRCVVVLLLLIALLTFTVGGVVPVLALAQEITPELEPVYDTEVFSLQDYVNNVLTDAQVAVFNTILGSYVASQAGLNEYYLEYPYTDRTGVIGWLQDAGMKLYNAIITGGSFDLVTGTDLRTYIVTAASYAIGMAQKAHTYTDMDDFLDDVDNSDHYFIPYDPILQASINSYFGRSYGLWNWQFNSEPFVSDFIWNSSNLGAHETLYNQYLSNMSGKKVKANRSSSYDGKYWRNVIISNFDYQDLVLFINTDRSWYSIYSLSEDRAVEFHYDILYTYGVSTYSNPQGVGYMAEQSRLIDGLSIDLSSFDNITDAARYLYNSNFSQISLNLCYPYDLALLCTRCFAGTSWATKQELFNVTDLNFKRNDSPSYNQVPDNSYIDLKGFLNDIVNNTNVLNVILDNLFKPDGTLNVDPALVKVSITIPDTNPLPVNLNEVALYLDNDYLDIVKQSATDYGNTIGQWFVFWHNSDPALLYTLLGSAIVILVGAFIGKWGHS